MISYDLMRRWLLGGGNEGEDQTCNLYRWDQAPWKCGQAVIEQSLPGEQSPFKSTQYQYAIDIFVLGTFAPSNQHNINMLVDIFLMGTFASLKSTQYQHASGHLCTWGFAWQRGCTFLLNFRIRLSTLLINYTVLIFSLKLSGQFDIGRNISAAIITYQCILKYMRQLKPAKLLDKIRQT